MTCYWISFNNGCSYTGVEGCRDGYCCTDLSDVCPAYGARPGEPDCYCDVSCSDTGDCCSDFLNECFRKCSRKWSSVFSYRLRFTSLLWRCLGSVYFFCSCSEKCIWLSSYFYFRDVTNYSLPAGRDVQPDEQRV